MNKNLRLLLAAGAAILSANAHATNKGAAAHAFAVGGPDNARSSVSGVRGGSVSGVHAAGDSSAIVNITGGGSSAPWWSWLALPSTAVPGNTTAPGVEGGAFGFGPFSLSWPSDNELYMGERLYLLGSASGNREMASIGSDILLQQGRNTLHDLRADQPVDDQAAKGPFGY